MRIAHCCPECGKLFYIEDDNTFTNADGEKVTNCDKCDKRLEIPRALREMRELQERDYENQDD